MALREILTEPNKILRMKSLPVEIVDGDLQKLMDDMLETMYAAPGIGLAAIQVGVPKKIIEIIGEDDIANLDPETIYFLNKILNELNLKKIRNDILGEALPVRV